MIPFLIVAFVMVAIALAWVVVPLMRRAASVAPAREAMNVAILRDQLKELDADLARGALTAEQHAEARRERVIARRYVLENEIPLLASCRCRRRLSGRCDISSGASERNEQQRAMREHTPGAWLGT